MVLAVSTFDDRLLARLIRVRVPATQRPARVYRFAAIGVGVLVAILSIQPVRNMLSPAQVMNTVYNRFHLVGTYGAFGSITRPRYEVIVEGTDEPAPTAATQWREYEFKGKPGALARLPPQIAPYHLRLDWLMWFAALSSSEEQPWFAAFMQKLLEADPAVLSLLRTNPFPDRAPRFVRALLYEYHFTTAAERAASGNWWTRRLVGMYSPPHALT
jgi:hypothetical protein